MSTWPPTPNWLSPMFDQFMMTDAELTMAYDWPDYPGELDGEGNWTDCYLNRDDEVAVGRVWVNPETNTAGILYLGGNLTYYTKSCLELREFFRHGVPALSAYDFIKSEYYAGAEQSGDLTKAKDGVVESQQPAS